MHILSKIMRTYFLSVIPRITKINSRNSIGSKRGKSLTINKRKRRKGRRKRRKKRRRNNRIKNKRKVKSPHQTKTKREAVKVTMEAMMGEKMEMTEMEYLP